MSTANHSVLYTAYVMCSSKETASNNEYDSSVMIIFDIN